MRPPVPEVGQSVMAASSPGGTEPISGIAGVVTKVWDGSRSGGNRAMLRVRWPNGYEGKMPERLAILVSDVPRGTDQPAEPAE